MPTYPYPRPAVTVDIVLLTQGDEVLLIQRKNPPFQNDWALPGGFIDEHEPAKTAAARELAEETGLTDIPLGELGFFTTPHRDPRGHTISLAFTARVKRSDLTPCAADDAKDVRWFPLSQLPPLAFDHHNIIARAVSHP